MPDTPDTPDTTIAAAPCPPTLTLGKLIDSAWALREKKRAAQTVVDELDGQISALEEIILARLDSEEVDTGRGKKASVAVTESVVFTITDFDLFCKFVARKKYFHLFQRRVTDLAAREIFQSAGQVPGLTPFTRRRVNLRSL